MADLPSSSYSITVRLEVPARGNTVSQLTAAVERAGGNLGALAALPVMEGKAALFKRLAGMDAFPSCLDTQDVGEIVRTVELIAPVFADPAQDEQILLDIGGDASGLAAAQSP